MGLSIYLYRYENRQETERLEKQYSDFSEQLWEEAGEYEKLTDDEKNALRDKNECYATSLGLLKDGDDPRKQQIETPSVKYPEHYFKVGYFRSSYNGGGINRVLSNLGLPDLYELFNRKNDDNYVWQPDWTMALVRVKDCLNRLKEKENIRCFTLDGSVFSGMNEITSEESAIKKYLEENHRAHFGDEGYSNIAGYFYHKEPLKVHALIHGTCKSLFADHQVPVTYVVMKGDNEWYEQALEIVIETIEYVLDQPDKDKYFLHWSS